MKEKYEIAQFESLLYCSDAPRMASLKRLLYLVSPCFRSNLQNLMQNITFIFQLKLWCAFPLHPMAKSLSAWRSNLEISLYWTVSALSALHGLYLGMHSTLSYTI